MVNVFFAMETFTSKNSMSSCLGELGEREQVQALATKRILALQAARRMSELGLSTTKLAERMRMSRNQILRILDKEDAGITLKMLFRLSRALDLRLRLAFDPPKPPRRRRAAS